MANRSNRGRNIATVILAILAVAILGVMAFLVGRAGLSSMQSETAASEDQPVSFAAIVQDEPESSVPSVAESVASAAESAVESAPESAAESVAESAAESVPEPAKEEVQEYPYTAYGAGYDINVRDAASTDGNILGTIQRGEAVNVTEEKDGWSTVDYNGQTGYIKSEYLSKTKTYDQVWDLTTLANDRLDFGYSSENRDGDNIPTDWRWYEAKWGQFNVDWIQDTTQKTIYLTLDEGFGNDNTIKILDTLKEKNVKATFFLTKNFVDERPELVQRMIDEGHSLGNHTCTHPAMPSLTTDQQTEEIMTLQNLVKEQFGYDMRLFRFPEGAYSDQSLGLVNNLGLKAVFWSYAYVDYNDDDQPPVDESLQKALGALHPGAIYLLHAKSDTNTAMLGDFIDGARDKGFEFGTYPLDAN